MKIETFEDFFVEQIKDLYSAEVQLIKALPNLVKAALSPVLKNAITAHLEETEEQARRLEQIFAMLDLKPSGLRSCEAMKGIIKDGKEATRMGEDIRDAAIIAAAQRVEHYEMSAYGTARHHARLLGFQEAAALLDATMREEEAADKKLNEIALQGINAKAMHRTSASPPDVIHSL